MTDDDADLVQEYALALRAYLRAHPRAADTLTGVVMFWLRGRPASRDEVVAVELALEQLVAESLLVKRASGDGHVIYVGAAGPSRKGH